MAQFNLYVFYQIINIWTTGYQVNVIINNNNSQSSLTWNSQFQLPPNQNISSSWNCVMTGKYIANNPGWNGGGVIHTLGSTTYGFVVSNPLNGPSQLLNLIAYGNGGLQVPTMAPVPTRAPTMAPIPTQAPTMAPVPTRAPTMAPVPTRAPTMTPVPTRAPTMTPVPTNPQAPTLRKTFLEGYWESWSSDPIANIINMSVDIIDISFVTFSNSYQVIGLDCDQATLTNFITAAHNAGKKVKISAGGATYPFSGFLTSLAAAQSMANSIAAYVKLNNLDGVDYDIEDPVSANLQIALIQYTRTVLGPNYIISYTVKTPASSTEPYISVMKGAYNYFSYTSLMCYDAYPGYNYALDINTLISIGIPANKIVLGLMPSLDDVGHVTTLNDIKVGANYVLNNNLAGLMMWSLNRDLDNDTGFGSSASFDAAYAILG
jgi:chitinase